PQESEWVFWQASIQVDVIDGVRELLEALRDLGLPMAVISNSSFSGVTLRRELDRQGIGEFFRFLVSSADYGVRKPDPLIFEVALRRLGLDARQVWFAGDHVGYDIIGAHGAGIFPVAFNPRKEIPGDIGEHAVLTHWGQLVPLIAGAARP
ncbi:MAG TPA: HAD-IA family hydrolase, partial [Spirochaetia bacterium]|nr:HAD-IA family hydrolase [Spirochaetia bacterium]